MSLAEKSRSIDRTELEMVGTDGEDGQMKDTAVKENRGPGNFSQENYSECVECPGCGEETRVDCPSVGLVTCPVESCDLGAFTLSM